MKKYQQNILVSSLPKSGTILTLSIVKEISKLNSVNTILNKNKNKKRVSYGGINNVTKKGIYVSKNFHNNNNSIYNHELYDITSDIEENRENYIFAGHTSPDKMMTNKILSKINKKIYIYRYGLDVVNSKMKFIENLDYTLALMDGLKTQDKYQALRYATPSKVLEVIDKWQKYAKGYLQYKDEFYGIIYENLLLNPKEEIKRLANYLEINISDNEIKKIIKKLYFRELGDLSNNHKHYRHYNESKKIAEWTNYLPYEFYIEFEKENKHLLKNLGYSLNNISSYKNNKFHDIFERKLSLFQQRQNMENSNNIFIKSFVDVLNRHLRNKKIAIYGYNNYSKYIQSSLNTSVDIVMICDINFKKINKKSVISPKKLLTNALNYDFILILDDLINQESISKSIKKVLRLHGGIEIINGCNKSHYLNNE